MDGTWSRLPRIFLAGIYREPVLWRSPGNTRKFGIRLKPETFHMLFRAPAATLFQDYTSFENIEKGAGPFAGQVSEAKSITEVITLTEAFLMAQLAKNRIENNYLVQAANIIRSSKGDISIEEVSRSVAVSTRQLQRSFKDCFGTSPKTYLRIIRFSNAYKNLLTVEEQGGWAGLSYSLGYADQAHFIREFKEFTGTIPRIMLLNDNQVFGKVS